MKKLTPSQDRWLSIISVIVLGLFMAAMSYLILREFLLSIYIGVGSSLFLTFLVGGMAAVTKIDGAIYKKKFEKSGEWVYIDSPLSMFVFSFIFFPFLAMLSVVSIFSLYFAIFADEPLGAKLFAVVFLGCVSIMLPWITVGSAIAAYRFLFVTTRFDDTRIERRGPIGRGRSFSFRQIHSAGWNSKLSHIWIRSADEDRIVISCSDFGAYDLYTKLRTEIGARYIGQPWPAALNPHRDQPA